MRPSHQPAIKAINRSTPCILCKLFVAWVALGVYVPLQPSLHAQQVELRGTVSVHNSKYETGEVIYVQNAYLSAPFTVPATSDVEGNFVLEFVGLASGTALKIEAEKAGLEVVNTHELEEVVIGRKFPLRIYVAEKGKLAKAQIELYKVSQQALFASRDQMIVRLRGEKAQSEAAMAELQERFGQELKDRFEAEDLLRKKVDEQQKQLPEFAMMLAKKNLDNASELYIQAYELFKEGKIAEVIKILNSEKLKEDYNKARKVKLRGETLVTTGEYLLEQNLILAQRTIKYHQKFLAIYQKQVPINPKEIAHSYEQLGLAYARGKQPDSARVYFNKYATIVSDTAKIYRHRAIEKLLVGKSSEALEWLEEAIKRGYNDLHWLTKEPLLEPLRTLSQYQVILEKLLEQENNYKNKPYEN